MSRRVPKQSTEKLRSSLTRIGDRVHELPTDTLHFDHRRRISTDPGNQPVDQSQGSERLDVIGHRRDALAELLQLFHRTPRNARGSLFAHGVDEHLRRIQSENAIGLVPVGQKCA